MLVSSSGREGKVSVRRMHNQDELRLLSMQMTCQSCDGFVLTDTVTAWWQQLKNPHSLLVYIYNRSILMHFPSLISCVVLQLVQRRPHISQDMEFCDLAKVAGWYVSSALLRSYLHTWNVSANTRFEFFIKSQARKSSEINAIKRLSCRNRKEDCDKSLFSFVFSNKWNTWKKTHDLKTVHFCIFNWQ